MKKKIILLFVSALIVAGFTACNKSEEAIPDNSIEGRYVGTLTIETVKSATRMMPENTSASADITKTGDGEIEVHCYSDELDTTFMLDYFDNHDSVMVCLTGDAFQEMYGHRMGEGHMSGGMMGDINDGETEWQHHRNDEHQFGDQHFGGFDLSNHTFGYRFITRNGNHQYMLDFQGTKSL